MIFHTKTKINIGLSVLGKRNDGFHNIECIFYPLDFGDVLEVIQVEGNNQIDFESYGINIPGDSSKNLCVQAYLLLNEDYNLPSVKSALLKRVPIGAGLGGGSSDGVEMLKALNNIFNLKIPKIKLNKYALQLGSDCPFFIDSSPKLVTGRGELMKEINLNLQDQWIVLVFPSFHVSTPLAYSLISPKKPGFNLSKINELSIEGWEDKIINDFENPIAEKHSEIHTIKKSLLENGAKYTSMSGSGSTVYGIFATKPNIKKLEYPTWIGKLKE